MPWEALAPITRYPIAGVTVVVVLGGSVLVVVVVVLLVGSVLVVEVVLEPGALLAPELVTPGPTMLNAAANAPAVILVSAQRARLWLVAPRDPIILQPRY